MFKEPEARRELIVDEVRRLGSVRASDLAEAFDVSPLTVRRDIAMLQASGRLRRVHGGAVRRIDPPLRGSSDIALRQDATQAALASAQLRAGEAVALVGGGHVAVALAKGIVRRRDLRPLTVVTTSLGAAAVLAQRHDPGLNVVLSGGEQSASGGMVGAVTERAFGALNLDVALFVSTSIGRDGRLAASTFAESSAWQVALTSTRRAIAVVNGELGRSSLASWGKLTDLDVVVTTVPPDGEIHGIFERAKVALVVTCAVPTADLPLSQGRP